MKVNIPQTVVDPFYRYKRDVLIVKHLSRNGGLTQLENIVTIAKQIYTDSIVLVKYIQKSLSMPPPILKGDTIAFTGLHDAKKLDTCIEAFIKESVCCPTCNIPEYTVNGNVKTCKACGKCIRR